MMISHIRTVGLKGFDIDEDIPPKVIYTGPNMTGKTTRSYGIALALEGHVSFSDAGKKPGDILDSFGDGKMLAAAVTVGGTEFGRKFSRNPKGVASQSVQLKLKNETKSKKASKENFAIMMDKAGKPKIADVAEFMRQSDAKKVDTLFDLYPCPELAEIDEVIENAKADISRLNSKIDGAESTVKRLTQSKESYQLPAGSISECQSAINKVEIQITDLEKQIHDAEIAEAEEKAMAEGEQKERERAEKEENDALKQIAAEPLKTDQDWKDAGIDSMPSSPEMQKIDRTISGMEKQIDGFHRAGMWEEHEFPPDDTAKSHDIAHTLKSDVQFSIQKIINAMTQTGCTTCAALIVAKQELKKYKGV